MAPAIRPMMSKMTMNANMRGQLPRPGAPMRGAQLPPVTGCRAGRAAAGARAVPFGAARPRALPCSGWPRRLAAQDAALSRR